MDLATALFVSLALLSAGWIALIWGEKIMSFYIGSGTFG